MKLLVADHGLQKFQIAAGGAVDFHNLVDIDFDRFFNTRNTAFLRIFDIIGKMPAAVVSERLKLPNASSVLTFKTSSRRFSALAELNRACGRTVSFSRYSFKTGKISGVCRKLSATTDLNRHQPRQRRA